MNIKPAAGAFASPQVEGVDNAQDPAEFLAQLSAMGLVPPQGGGAQVAPPPAKTAPSPLAELQGMVQRTSATRPSKSVFTPGKPGQPKSGARAHELLKDPAVIETLASKIEAWEQANPGRKLMGSHIQQMLPDVSAAQARTIKRMLDRELSKATVADPESYMQRAAGAAMKG